MEKVTAAGGRQGFLRSGLPCRVTTREGIMEEAGCWGHERAWGLGHTQMTCPMKDMWLRCRCQ